MIRQCMTPELIPLLLHNDIDLGIVAASASLPLLYLEPLLEDQVYLCVSDRLLDQYYPKEKEALKERGLHTAYIQDFARLPVCAFTSTMWERIRICYEDAGLIPNVYMNSNYSPLGSFVCFKGMAACFLTQMHLASSRLEIPADLNIFPLYYKQKPIIHNVNIVYSKQRYLPNYSRYLIQLLLGYASNIKTVSMRRIAFSKESSSESEQP